MPDEVPVDRLRFLSRNEYKFAEFSAMLAPYGFKVIRVDTAIEELLQSEDVEKIVEDKLVKAFERVGYPLFVEHTVLCIHAMNGFPGGLTQVFWETLQADRVAELFGRGQDTRATARSVIGFCDGRRTWQFSGEIQGRIASEPRGPRDFQWDCVFIPEGESRTFAEMGTDKNIISHRRIVLDKFVRHLQEQCHDPA